MDAILEEWDAFARSLRPHGAMTAKALRDDAESLLRFIAADVETDQTAAAQKKKSEGRGEPSSPAASDHAIHRFEQGFDINEMVSEYRAIRASVLRLLGNNASPAEAPPGEETARFHEAIDQAVAESVGRFTAELNRSKDLLLAVLGHDLRNPLQSVVMLATSLLMRDLDDSRREEIARRILRSAQRQGGIIDDLLDFARTRLGTQLPMVMAHTSLNAMAEQTIEELRAVHPEREFKLELVGDLNCHCDAARIAQLLSNLAGNAAQYGYPNTPVSVTLTGKEHEIELKVHNQGIPLTAEEALTVFDPLVRAQSGRVNKDPHNLGLGLYIARMIARGHAGDITVQSSSDGTTFVVTLPRGL